MRTSIRHGADSIASLGQQCRVGVDCGRCRPALRDLLSERGLMRSEPSDPPVMSTSVEVA